jgi:hypothetical protein
MNEEINSTSGRSEDNLTCVGEIQFKVGGMYAQRCPLKFK